MSFKLLLIISSFVSNLAFSQVNDSNQNMNDRYKILQKKLEICQNELSTLKNSLNENEKRIEDLESNPLQRSGYNHCRDCDLNGDSDLFIKWNKNLDSIKSRSLDLLTDEENLIKLLCKTKDSCKANNPYAHYTGTANDLLGKKIEDKGGSCGVLYDISIPIIEGNEHKKLIRLYQILLSKPDQEVVETCWYVKNKLEYNRLQEETKKDISSSGNPTIFSEFKKKQLDCNNLEEELNSDDYSIFNLPSEDSRNEEEPEVENLTGIKNVNSVSAEPDGNTNVSTPLEKNEKSK